MTSPIGYGAAAIRHGEQRYAQAIVNLLQATQDKPGETPSTVVESKPAGNVGSTVDVKA